MSELSAADVIAEAVHQHIDTADTFEEVGVAALAALEAAGYAIVGLPTPDRQGPRVWRGSFGMAFYATKAGTVGTPDGAISVAEARADAAALLAAAREADKYA